MLLAVTDSGLGGLSVCAAIERGIRESTPGFPLRLAYVNAWPDERRGYNDFPDMAARAAVFDAALGAIASMRPDALLIACNTLSILYAHTAFSRAGAFPVHGIVDAGTRLFVDALRADRDTSIVLLGTRTTIASGAHRDRLVAAGIDPSRIAGVACHGLATAIERDLDGPGVGTLLAECAAAVAAAVPSGRTVFAGLCCTHYGYVAARVVTALESALGRPVCALDPNERMARDVVAEVAGAGGHPVAAGVPAVDVVSKVTLDERTRSGIGRLVRPVSALTADALMAYRHVPDLFRVTD